MNRSGMTLLELVVALAITGLAVSAGYGAFATLADRKEIAGAAAERMLRDASARASLSEWLSASRLTIQDDEIEFRSIDGLTREKLDDDDLTFFTTASTPVGVGGSVVRLFIDRSDSTSERGLVAELREWKGTRSLVIELVPAAAGLHARVLSGVFGRRQWVDSWVSTSVLPAGARIHLAAAEGDSLPALWRLPMTVSLEGGR